MDWKTFFVEVVDKLAWPLTVIFFFYMFREQAASLINKVGHLKYKDFELEFDKIERQAQQVLENADDKGDEKKTANDDKLRTLSWPYEVEEQEILREVESSPAAAILLSWALLEVIIREVSTSPKSDKVHLKLLSDNISYLKKAGEISEGQEKLLLEMRKLRNQVSHEFTHFISISEEQAAKYARTAIDFSKTLYLLAGREFFNQSSRGKWISLPDNFTPLGMTAAMGCWKVKSMKIPNTTLTADVGYIENENGSEVYSIGIFQPTESGGTLGITQLNFIAEQYVSDSVEAKDITEIINYDDTSKTITFDLGKSVFVYQLY